MPAQAATIWVQDVLAILGFMFENFWKLFSLTLLIVFRKGLASVVGRLVKANFNVVGWGEGGFEATPAVLVPEVLPETAPKSEPPSEAKSVEMERQEVIEEITEDECPSFSDVYMSLKAGEIEEAEDKFREYHAAQDDPERKYSDEAFYLYLLFVDAGKQDALKRLATLHAGATTDQQLEASTSSLAACYSLMKDYEKEEKVWNDAIAQVREERLRTVFISGLASLYDKKGNTDQGITLLQNRLRAVVEKEQKSRIYSALANLEKKKGGTENAAVALEKAVECDPGDHDKLFAAAYQQGELKMQLLAVANYRTLLGLDRKHLSAQNNLAVCAGALKIPGKKVQLYKDAIEGGLTLSMANLANDKIDAGLFDEAQAILDEARVKENPHENVGHAIYRLERARKDDQERWIAVGKKAIEFQRKVRVYGEALFEKPAPQGTREGTWYTAAGDECVVTMTPLGVSGTWTEVKTGLGYIFSAPTKIQCSIIGPMQNRTARVVYQKRDLSEKKPTTLLSMSTDSTSVSCYSYLSDDEQEWYFFSTEPESDVSFSLTRGKPGG